jgi:hypothetical protein
MNNKYLINYEHLLQCELYKISNFHNLKNHKLSFKYYVRVKNRRYLLFM